jgi:predicted nucleic-acid-binding protein
VRALDTKPLVRFLVSDDEKQAQAVRQVMLDSQEEANTLFIPLAVTIETIWVLSSAYGYSKEETVRALEAMLVLPVFEMEHRQRLADLCRLAMKNDAGLVDLLIGLTSRDRGCATTLTFDKRPPGRDSSR